MSVADSPQVRTLLLTDLVDSTQLVERLGDVEAAGLFRAHDSLVMELQQRWRGRLIDRSDGLLLIFERPIDGLGFALDYVRGLRDLGRERGLKQPLRARAGLHVGEVLLWENSVDAVQLGAKSLEIEGLAKPLAGRLMALARPGQILLSATAEPLAHRAVRELGERGELLVWKSYGRWRFKGVPEAQEVHEVGEPGLAPLRMPSHTPKAWRDLPLWRRPVALAAEAMLLGCLVVGGWFLTRPQPAIAFVERDWVVMGDVRNLTGDTRLDDSLEQAFRLSLEQSRYVNVLSDLKVRDTLKRMQRKPEDRVDRLLGSEIAQRDGARALLLPTVAEVGGRLRVSAEVVDPVSQTTVYAVHADGRGLDSVLASIDDVSGQLRNKLGEAMQDVRKSSVPLPNVSTPSLDALRAYALGLHKANSNGDFKAAIAHMQQALQIDPQFAMARAALGAYQYRVGQSESGLDNLRSALAQSESRLSDRERLRLQALMAELGPVDVLMQKSRQLIEMYPDDLAARARYVQVGWGMRNEYAQLLPDARAATAPMSPVAPVARHLEGILLLGMGRYDEAQTAFRTETSAGFGGEVTGEWTVALARNLPQQAQQAYAKRVAPPDGIKHLQDAEFGLQLAASQGNWKEAKASVDTGHAEAETAGIPEGQWTWRIRQKALQCLSGGALSEDKLHGLLRWLDANQTALQARYRVYPYQARLEVAYLATCAGHGALARQILAMPVEDDVRDWSPITAEFRQVVQARVDALAGNHREAIARLRPLVSDNSLILTRATLAQSLQASGDAQGARAEHDWLIAHRGRAYVEQLGSGGMSVLTIAAIPSR